MVLTAELQQQLGQYLTLLEKEVVLKACLGEDPASQEVKSFLEEVVALSDKLSLTSADLKLKPSFTIDRKDYDSGICFAGLPLGHEFESFVLALLQVGGRAPKISPEQKARIEGLKQTCHFETFVSLSCHNCPDVVQALNIISLLNPNISHSMIEGGSFKDLADKYQVMAVPTIFLDGKEWASGRQNLDQILDLLSPQEKPTYQVDEPYDCLVIGGGPAGASAAIYTARKGLKVALVAKSFGGQVNETLGIENMIGQIYTEGPKLMQQIRAHVEHYPIDLIENVTVSSLEVEDEKVKVSLAEQGYLTSKTLIVATGAHWRLINVPGEKEFKAKGISYCPHCDGPLFKDKPVVVIGGGNSGIEAALDMANLASSVTVLEYADHLKADAVLLERLREKSNVTIVTKANTTAIEGQGKVQSLTYVDRDSQESHTIKAEGVFILVGLVPNTDFVKNCLTLNDRGEIIVDERGQSNQERIFAAGDCTNSTYKQIVISMGSGATAALSAHDYLMRQG